MLKIRVIFTLMIINLIAPHFLQAWDDGRTHTDLSEKAARVSVLGTQDYLKNIGFKKGLDEEVNGKEVFKWIRDGAEQEDEGSWWDMVTNHARFNNHFHNPLKSWDEAGLNDTFLKKTFTGISSIKWAQDGSYQAGFPGGDWSWQKVREYYYLALTSRTEEERQVYFARTFMGLGHQMHLVQDAAVPAHVRNDLHAEDSIYRFNIFGELYFEGWAKEHASFINFLTSNPDFPQLNLMGSINGMLPISKFIDTDRYNGNNPSVTLAQGLSEYTNSNFFSDDTVFASERFTLGERHYFPYPKSTSTDLDDYINGVKPPETISAEDGNVDTSIWISKITNGEEVQHFVRPSYLTSDLLRNTGRSSLFYKSFYRDEKCHEDYARRLIPRAVGYSVALLNYFFRGEIDMVFAETGSGYVILNNTDEDMSGKFELWYDDKNDERKLVKSWSLTIGKISSGNNKSTNITFTPPSDAKEQGRYILVFRGKLGSEDNAVVGKILKLSWPRGGVIKRVSGKETEIVVSILYENEVKTYWISVLPNERIIKAAFDEGDVDTIRVLSLIRTTETGVYNLHTFVYDRDNDQYIEKDIEEIERVNYSEIENRYGFSYTTKTYYGSNTSYKGFVLESTYDPYYISDFFVSKGLEVKFLKGENKYISLLKFTTNFEEHYTHKEGNCVITENRFEEYIGGSLDNPECRKYGTIKKSCGEDKSWDKTGYCQYYGFQAYNIGYTHWTACDDGSFLTFFPESVSVWLYDTLEYDGFSRKLSNPELIDTSKVWIQGASGPCTLFKREALSYRGSVLSGKILSDRQIVIRSYIKEGNNTSEVISIEPDGTGLDKMPVLILRQSGGYSMLEDIQAGKVINHTSFLDIPSDKPILLNMERNGFKMTFETYVGQSLMKLQVGVIYNERTQDFTKTSAGIYMTYPTSIMDLMVEYRD